jgi:RNase P subunit RPR2
LLENAPRQLVRPQRVPQLVKLKFKDLYCEECRTKLSPGELVGWWWVRNGKGARKTAYCAACHRGNARTFK